MQLDIPVLRTEGESMAERLTETAYHQILPARYLNKNSDGEIIEDQEEMFERVAKNIAVAEAAHVETPIDIRVDSLRDAVVERHRETHGSLPDATSDGDFVSLTEQTAKFVDYETVVDRAPTATEKKVRAVKEQFQHMMENLKFVPNTPTIANAGDTLQQLSACFVNSPDDDMQDIHQTAKEAASVFQSGGGQGYAFHHLRPYGDSVGGTGGIASGPITFMRTFDQMCATIAQGGMRRGAQMGIMAVWHPDIIQFIHAKDKDVSLAQTLKLNDPDDFTHTSFEGALEEAREILAEGQLPEYLRNAIEGHLSNFNISVGITEEFMDAVEADSKFVCKNPRTGEPHIATAETEELYGMFGLGEYVEAGHVLEVPARELWERIAEGAHENGEPGVIFLDRINDDHSFDVDEHPEHEIHATNPCVTGDTLVATADGREAVRIDELAEEGEDVPVYSRAEDGSVVVRNGMSPRKTREDATIYEVETDGNVTFRCTPDHELYVNWSGYVEAQNLEEGDSLSIMKREYVDRQDPPEIRENHKVVSVREVGSENVYNITVEDTHNFYAGINVVEGNERVFLNTHNCGEQPLEEYEACNLGHINLSTVVAEDRLSYSEWHEQTFSDGNWPSVEKQVERFLEQAIDWDEFNERITVGTRFLENVVTMSDFPIPEITEKVRRNRKVGLGIMGLAQLYIQCGVKYGSDVANEIGRQLMMHINHQAKAVSHQLAKERGVFANWEKSKYANPTEFPEWFEKQTGQEPSVWADGYPIRNHNVTTVAPTGTTSMIGNTTGGCEPVYNVANFKNVTDDVQGDEMLVQFDSLFLRVLEANGIDVDTVKEEAKEQMMNNEFDGIDSLERVPDELAELFVTTGDLSANEHAGVQCALQEGVDSALSKTVNAPHDDTVADALETFQFVYENGGKGVTYYRDGTRSKQVLTTRQDNQAVDTPSFDEWLEMAGYDELMDFFESDEFGSVVRSDDVQIEYGERGWLESAAESDETRDVAEPEERPRILDGRTVKVDTGYGSLYVVINEKNGRPFEVMATVGKSGATMEADTEAIARLISLALRSGVPVSEVIDQLRGIEADRVAWENGTQISSVADGIAYALQQFVADEPVSGSMEVEEIPESDDVESDGGVGVVCPLCGSSNVMIQEGCETCGECGWSKC